MKLDTTEATLLLFALVLAVMGLWAIGEMIADHRIAAKLRRLRESDARVDRSKYATRSHLRPLL